MTSPLEELCASRAGNMYVMGAMDPLYASEASVDEAVKALCREGSVASAVAFLTGWVNHHPGVGLPLHRTTCFGAVVTSCAS